MRTRPELFSAVLAFAFVGSLFLVGRTALHGSNVAQGADQPVPAVSAVQPVPTAKTTPTAPAQSTSDPFRTKILPLLNTHCNSCHNSEQADGGLALDRFRSEADAKKDRHTWQTVRERVAAGEMPPKKKPQPTKEEKEFLLNWIDTTALALDCSGPRNPGRVTLRRLNRNEYNNTIRDLCGVSITPADDFPADDVGYGFDNIGDVLSVQPILLEKYLAAADTILQTAIVKLDPTASSKQLFRSSNIQVVPRFAKSREGRRPIRFTTDGEAWLDKFNFPATGDYKIRVRAWGQAEGGVQPKIEVRVGDSTLKTFEVEGTETQPLTYVTTHKVEFGERRITVKYLNPSKRGIENPRALGIVSIEVEGPIGGAAKPIPESTTRILTTLPKSKQDEPAAAKEVLADFASRAFRRPVAPAEVDRLMTLFTLAKEQGEPFEKAIQLPLKAVLVSPHFLFRIEADPKDAKAIRRLNDYELATRLSYFLWSSMPDEELFEAAARGDLTKPNGMDAQIRRMIADPKSEALVENFAGQWLQLRSLETFEPNPKQFGTWDNELRRAMERESELYFDYIMRNDRSVLEFVDSDYTFVNARLAKHYGIKGITGPEFRLVNMRDGRRGGVITQASVLTVTSNPTRTSLVKRGKWVYENILGLKAPPPAPDVPELPPVGELKGTVRQQLEQHRADPNCAACHAKLDPLGFGLENFDAIGAWRDKDNNLPVDASGILPDGATFTGPAELRRVLLSKADLFRHCLAEKLMTYALGRGLEYYDDCTLVDIVNQLKAGDDKFSALVIAITHTDAFQTRKGTRSE